MMLLVLSLNMIRASISMENCQGQTYQQVKPQQPLALLISANKVIAQSCQSNLNLIHIDLLNDKVINNSQTYIRIHDQYQTLIEHSLIKNQKVIIIIRSLKAGNRIAFIYLFSQHLTFPQGDLNTFGFKECLKYENTRITIDTDCDEVLPKNAQLIQSWQHDHSNTIDRYRAEIAFQIYYDQGVWMLNDVNYTNCQNLLYQINHDLLKQLGFKDINIYLNIGTLTTSIICRVQNQTNLNIIVTQSNLKQQNALIEYVFDGFNKIIINNCMFEFKYVFMKSNTLVLQNILISEISSEVHIQSLQIEVFNMTCISSRNSIFLIESQNVMINISDISIQNTTLRSGYFFTLPQSSLLSIEITGIIIKNTTLMNFLFFKLQNYDTFNLKMINLSIIDSDIINTNSTNQFLFLSTNLQIQNLKIINVNLKKLILFQALVVSLTNLSFIKVRFITTQMMNNLQYRVSPNYVSLSIYKIEVEDCFVSSVLKNSISLSLFDVYQISLKIAYLSIIGTAFQLFNATDCSESSFTNIILFNISNNQEISHHIFEIHSNNLLLANVTASTSAGYFTIFEIKSAQVLMSNVSIFNFEYESELIRVYSERITISQLQIISFNSSKSIEVQFYALQILATYDIYFSNCTLILRQPIIFISHLIRIDKLYIEQMVTSSGITDNALLIIQYMNLTIVNSKFHEVQQTYYNCEQVLDKKCSFNYINNHLRIFNPHFEFLTLISIKWVNYIYISHNILESNKSNTITFFNIAVLEQSQILDNIMITQGQALSIFNLNNNTITLIRNLTIKSYDMLIHPYPDLSALYIRQGSLFLSDILIETRSYIIMDFTQQVEISIDNVNILNSIINIFIRVSTDYGLHLLMRNISSLNQYQIPRDYAIKSQREFRYISISSLGSSQIKIINLTIKGLSPSYIQHVLIYIKLQFHYLLLDNLQLIQNTCSPNCIDLIDLLTSSKEARQTIINNAIIFNNNAMNIIHIILPSITIENCFIQGYFNSSFTSQQKDTLMYIKNSEIILNNTVPSKKFDYLSNNTRLKEYVKIYQEFRVSFDDGKNFAQNLLYRDGAQNDYRVIFGKNQNHFYIPSGQRLDEFYLLNRTALQYTQYKLILFFDFKEQAKNPPTICSFVYQDYQLNELFFNLGDKLNYSIMVIAKAWTQVNFITVCDIGDPKPALFFKAIVMDCQLGEMRLHDICLPCDIQLQQYSVKVHSTVCFPLNEIQMKSVDRALIELNPGYWRPYFTNDQIETCTRQQESCLGGVVFGNKLCKVGYVGAICSECDLFQQQNSQTYIKNPWLICNPCNVTIKQIAKQILSFVISAILVFVSVTSYYQTTKKNILISISWPPYQKIVKWQFDSLGIWIGLLSYYCQNLINFNQNSILSLAPFYIDYDFLTNTSFNFMNLIDCICASYFKQEFWIYLRVLFIIMNYLIIFQLFVFIKLLYLKKTKTSYSLMLITMPIISIYNANILNVFTQQFILNIFSLILLLLPIQYSGYKWIQAFLTGKYDTPLHKLMIIIFILPSTFVIVIVLPIIFLLKVRVNINNNTLRNHFRYFCYLYKKNAYYFELLSKLFSQIILIQMYAVKNVIVKLFALILIMNIQYFAFAYIQPYYSKKLTNWNLTILLMLDIQLIISGLIGMTANSMHQILSIIFYLISAYVILNSLVQILIQISDEYYQLFDKVRLKLVPYLGNKLLKEHRLFRIKRYYCMIREDLRTRSASKRIIVNEMSFTHNQV